MVADGTCGIEMSFVIALGSTIVMGSIVNVQSDLVVDYVGLAVGGDDGELRSMSLSTPSTFRIIPR